MQQNVTLYELYENCPNSSSNILYCDGINKVEVTHHELHKRVIQISIYLDSLQLSQTTICCLIRPCVDLPAIILG